MFGTDASGGHSAPALANCILWGNAPDQIVDDSGAVTTVRYSNVQDAWPGVGNIDTDPLFVRGPDPGMDDVWGTDDDDYGDLRLLAGSPCIDAADNAAVPMGITTDLDGHDRFVDDPTVADTGNGLPGDAIVDIGAFERQRDCNDNGIPDVTEIPQAGAVSSTWVGVGGLWDDPPENLNWCLPEAPNNNPNAIFRVTINGPEAIVTLNISPTIDALTIEDGATLEVNSVSVDPLGLFVGSAITNTGHLRATDGKRLLVDALEINQEGRGELEGTLEAADGGVLQISGATVNDGIAWIQDCESRIELIGGAEFNNVTIVNDCNGRGDAPVGGAVAVPDGQGGQLNGTISNPGLIRVEAGDGFTTLQPGIDGVELIGVGVIELRKEILAWFGAFGRTITNRAAHSVRGAGVLFGGLTNEGTISADAAGEDLILFPPGDKTNSGVLRATDGGTLRIEDDVTQTEAGIIEATNCGIVVINAPISDTGDSGGLLRTCDGSIRVGPDVRVDIASGSVTGDGLGISLVSVSCGATLNVAGRLSVEDRSARSLRCAPSPAPGACATMRSPAAARGGCDPPPPPATSNAHLTVMDLANVNIEGSLRLIGGAGVRMAETAVVTLAGDFDNQGTNPAIFNWTQGSLTMDGGGADQMLEAAGEDRGADPSGFMSNFAIGRFELTPGALVTITDSFDNQSDGGSCEALYVDRLILPTGAQLVCSCPLYFEHLSGDVAGLCPEAVQIPTGDFDGDDDVELDDFAAYDNCVTGPGGGPITLESGCGAFDFDFDHDVDLLDWGHFQSVFGR